MTIWILLIRVGIYILSQNSKKRSCNNKKLQHFWGEINLLYEKAKIHVYKNKISCMLGGTTNNEKTLVVNFFIIRLISIFSLCKP